MSHFNRYDSDSLASTFLNNPLAFLSGENIFQNFRLVALHVRVYTMMIDTEALPLRNCACVIFALWEML